MKSLTYILTLSFALSVSTLAQTNNELQKAVITNDIELATKLLNEGADINWRNKEGQNLLFYTSERPMLELLIKYGINIDEKDNNSKTALVDAIEKKKQQKAFILLEYNASIKPVNDHFTKLKTDKYFLKYLKNSGANFTLRDKEYKDLEEAGYIDLAGILGVGLLTPGFSFANKSIPFQAGGTIGYVPYYKYKANGTALIEFIGSGQIYFINLKFTPTIKYTFSPRTYAGVGVEYNYILNATYSKELERDDKPDLTGYRSSIAPYICIGSEDDENIMEFGYRARTKSRPGQIYFLMGFKLY